MQFLINFHTWEINFKNSEELLEIYKKEYDDEAYFCFGLTIKPAHVIYINKDMVQEQQIDTLKHELTHCYIWEYGLYNVPNFNEEMACDLVAASNNFINSVIVDFKNYIKSNKTS